MDISNMKNIIILKNLPSNLVEEAIVILKQNKKVKRPELIENKKQNFSKIQNSTQTKKDDFIISEAQAVIADYISKVEEQDLKGKKRLNKLEEKYKKLKIITAILGVMTIVCLMINLL